VQRIMLRRENNRPNWLNFIVSNSNVDAADEAGMESCTVSRTFDHSFVRLGLQPDAKLRYSISHLVHGLRD